MDAPAAAREVFGDAVDIAARYADLLATKGVEWGLIGPREAERIWERHVLNSVAVATAVPVGARVVDVGSGAGLPGIPLALARPDLHVTLLEPLLRRATFLEETVAELGLGDRVDVVRARAEDHHARYDIVTCRAVARLSTLLLWCAPLLGPVGSAGRGSLVALKGASAASEVDAAASALRRFRLRARVKSVETHAGAEPTFLIICEA